MNDSQGAAAPGNPGNPGSTGKDGKDGGKDGGNDAPTETAPASLATAESTEAPPPKPPRPLTEAQKNELTLKEAFPSVEAGVIKAVLRASGGQVEPAFHALLGLLTPFKNRSYLGMTES